MVGTKLFAVESSVRIWIRDHYLESASRENVRVVTSNVEQIPSNQGYGYGVLHLERSGAERQREPSLEGTSLLGWNSRADTHSSAYLFLTLP